ncbi:hypothetical protein EV363DRAFT_1555513 [Boletus edulis]|nr:hypothetical protein EV363DRAFT_1555513 [Boletus edulis]
MPSPPPPPLPPPPQAALLGSNRGLQDQFSLLSRDLVGASRGPFLVFHRTRQPHPSDLIPPVPHWRLSRALPRASLDSSNPSNRPQPTRCASSQPLLVGHIDRLDDTSSRDLTHHLERLQPTDYLGTSLAPLVDPSLYFTGLVNPIHQTLYLRYPIGASREPFLVRRWTRQTHQTDPNQPAVPPLNPSSDLTHHLERLQPTDYLGTSLAPLVDPSLYFTGLVNPIHQTLYLRYPVGASREPFLVRRWTRQTHQTDPNQPAVPPLNPSSSATSIGLMTPPPGT